MSSEWVDASGTPWRFSTATKLWQKRESDGTWSISALPSGGLRKVTPGINSTNAVIIETMGPPGPPGDPGPPGLTYIAISEVLPAQLQNGVNATFPLSDIADLSQAIQVFRNGLQEVPGIGYLVTQNGVTFTTPPLDSDVIAVVYQKAQ